MSALPETDSPRATYVGTLALDDLRIDAALQQRVAGLDEDTVETYAQVLFDGGELPPGVAFGDLDDDCGVWLADGFHRAEAYYRAGRDVMPIEVRPGGRREALLYAVGANATHGRPRGREDVRRAIDTMLADEEWGAWSDRAIAAAVRCSPSTVASRRSARLSNLDSGEVAPATRIGRDGRRYDVSGLQAKPSAALERQADEHPALTVDELVPQLLAVLERRNAVSPGPHQIALVRTRLEEKVGALAEALWRAVVDGGAKAWLWEHDAAAGPAGRLYGRIWLPGTPVLPASSDDEVLEETEDELERQEEDEDAGALPGELDTGGLVPAPEPGPATGDEGAVEGAPAPLAVVYPDASVHLGDCLDWLASLEPESVDAIVTDPPYALSFMGKSWDSFKGCENAGFMYWFTGFVDGEGHFGIKRHTRGTHSPFFALSLRADDQAALEAIRREVGFGRIGDKGDEGAKHPGLRYVVDDKKGCQRLVDLFDKYGLRAKKRLDYDIWRQAVIEWADRPRGNRWHGPADDSRMASLKAQIEAVRQYGEPAWSGHPFQDWMRIWATACLRVLKPGGHLVGFGGTRTVHRLVCAVEDAGFEVRDQIGWLYYSGFPKSLDVSRAIDQAAGAEPLPTGEFRRASIQRNGSGENWAAGAFGSHPEDTKWVEITAPATPEATAWAGWGTALKPAIEPCVLARKPLAGTVAANVLAHGTGALHVNACRYAPGDPAWPGPSHSGWGEGGQTLVRQSETRTVYGAGLAPNGLADGPHPAGRWPANVYYTPKAPRWERELGCEGLPVRTGAEAVEREEDSAGMDSPRAGAGRTAEGVRNHHPTVKPVRLMRWLVRLVCPPGGLVVDPFAGSGTTGVAAVLEGLCFAGAEREPPYHAIASARIGHARARSELWRDTAPGSRT